MPPDVRVGQVWADQDPRAYGRTLRVDEINGGSAVCTILTNSDDTQALIDAGGDLDTGYTPNDRCGKQTRIKLNRFRPTSTGYLLVKDVPSKSVAL